MTTITAAMVKELREITSGAMMDCKKALTECDGDMEAAKEYLRKKGQASADKKSSRETTEGSISVATTPGKAALIKIACETDFVAINDDFQAFIAGLCVQAMETGVENFTEQTSSKGAIKVQFTEAIAKMGENMSFAEGASWDIAENAVVGAYTHAKGKIGVLLELTADKAVDTDKATALAKDVAMHIAACHVEAISSDDLDPAAIEKERTFLIDQAKESGKPDNIIEKMVEGRIQKFKKEICLLDQSFVKEPDKSIAKLLEEQGKALGVGFKVTRFFKSNF
ncbi:MAG: translation elongation factor Ts [SAR324 cluster bacterium]|nr:translation elongation factor Ts [SAR324 cluster bacterium]